MKTTRLHNLLAWAILILLFAGIGVAIGLVANQHERQRVERGIW